MAAAEYWVRTEGRARTVNEWKPRPGSPDNLYLPVSVGLPALWQDRLDCLVGAAVAASTLGATLGGAPVRRQKTNKRKRKNVSYL